MVRAKLMAHSGATRLIMGVQMFEAARAMILASLPPNLSEEEQKKLLFERVYSETFPVAKPN